MDLTHERDLLYWEHRMDFEEAQPIPDTERAVIDRQSAQHAVRSLARVLGSESVQLIDDMDSGSILRSMTGALSWAIEHPIEARNMLHYLLDSTPDDSGNEMRARGLYRRMVQLQLRDWEALHPINGLAAGRDTQFAGSVRGGERIGAGG